MTTTTNKQRNKILKKQISTKNFKNYKIKYG